MNKLSGGRVTLFAGDFAGDIPCFDLRTKFYMGLIYNSRVLTLQDVLQLHTLRSGLHAHCERTILLGQVF